MDGTSKRGARNPGWHAHTDGWPYRLVAVYAAPVLDSVLDWRVLDKMKRMLRRVG